MDNARDVLEHARRRAPGTRLTLHDLERRRSSRDAHRRIGTVAVALILAAIAVGSAFVGLREPGSVVASGGPDEVLPPAAIAPQVAEPGQFYYRAVLMAAEGCLPAGEGELPEAVSIEGGDDGQCGFTGTRLDATSWWNDDDAGRLVVDRRVGYGIDAGRFEPGTFPNGNGIDVSDWPLEPAALTAFLLERSAEDGASPAPLVTPPPEGAPHDGQLWRAITDLVQDPHVTPTVRAALLEVAATLQGSHVRTDVRDPAGRPAHVIDFRNWGGEVPERLYLDPATHELLAWTQSSTVDPNTFSIYLVQDAGVVAGTDLAPEEGERSVPLTVLSADDLLDLVPRG